MRRQDILVTVGASIVSAAAAAGATWYFGVKKVQADYEARLDKEVEESVAFLTRNIEDLVISDDVEDDFDYNEVMITVENESEVVSEPLPEVDGDRVFPDQEKMTLDELKARSHVVRYDKILEDEGYNEESVLEEEDRPEEGPVSWDPGNDEITVISRDIFMENASGFGQDTLTYFQDGGVIDVNSELVDDHEILIGIGKPPFGMMSDDPSIVYIRNKTVQSEYEVIEDPGNATDFLMHSLHDFYRPSQRQ